MLSFICRARVSPHVRAGVAVLPKGLWRHHTRNGATSNMLIPQGLADLGGGPVYNDARVDIAPGHHGEPVVMELEALDPCLYLDQAPGAAARLAAAITR